MEDEPTQDRPRRRPVLLAMLVAAALVVALAGSGAIAGGSGTARSDKSTGLTRDAPAASQSQSGGQGFMHNGRHCHHGQSQAPQQSPTEAPPV